MCISTQTCALVRSQVGKLANKRVTVILSDEEGEVFEAYCERQGFKKSTLIGRLIREHIENSGFTHQRNLFGESSPKRDQKNDRQ